MPYDRTNLTETQLVLLRAAGIMRERGLVTDMFILSSGEVCCVCAIAIAEGRMNDRGDYSPEIIHTVREGEASQRMTSFVGEIIDDWVLNHTADEVAVALEAAAFMEEPAHAIR